jgi:hypothetical protein
LPPLCADCAAPPAPVDAGPVHILGGARIADLELRYSANQHTYLPSQSPDGAVFAGGEALSVDGSGGAAPGFQGAVTAPVPLVLTQPASRPRLGDADFTVAWVPDRSTRIAITLIASTTDGRVGLIVCTAFDEDVQAVLPASLIAQLPPPPRDLQLEVSRDSIALADSAHTGLGVLLHAGFETTVDWHEDP